MKLIENSAKYWDSRHQSGDTGWDLGAVSPPIKAYFDQLTNPEISILIPGCGQAYEATYLIQKGFQHITLIDISETLIASLQKKFASEQGKWVRIHCHDFFEHEGQYDLIVEQTFFCALDPSLRQQYVQKMHQLLLPGGKLAGLLFNRQFDHSPPYGGSIDEYTTLFSPYFHIRNMEPCGNSATPRQNTELFFILEKK